MDASKLTTGEDDDHHVGAVTTSKKKKTTDVKSPSDVVLPRCDVAYAIDELGLPATLISEARAAELKTVLMDAVETDEMCPLYESLCATFHWPVDDALRDRLKEANRVELEAIEKQIERAEEEDNTIEVKDAALSKAHFYCRIGDWTAAVPAYERAHELCIGAGGRLDVLLTLVRIGLLFRLPHLTDKYTVKVQAECEAHGDWERRNKLKLYEAFAALKSRNWKSAALQLLECAPVFTATEFVPFERFVFAAAVLAQLELDRPIVKEQVLESPEVNQVMGSDPELREFVTSLYACQYGRFMHSLLPILARMKTDFWLRHHTPFFARSIRARVYKQFVAPFSSVTLETMSKSFELPADFIEEDVAEFVASGKLNCSIDRVAGVIVCTSQDTLREMQTEAMGKADKLLAQMQELARIVDM